MAEITPDLWWDDEIDPTIVSQSVVYTENGGYIVATEQDVTIINADGTSNTFDNSERGRI